MRKKFEIGGIPAILWGEPSDKLYLYVHGKLSSKEAAATFAPIAAEKGYQTLSFDLAQHGERTDEARLDVFSGVHDLNVTAYYAFSRCGAFPCTRAASARTFPCKPMGTGPLKRPCSSRPSPIWGIWWGR